MSYAHPMSSPNARPQQCASRWSAGKSSGRGVAARATTAGPPGWTGPIHRVHSLISDSFVLVDDFPVRRGVPQSAGIDQFTWRGGTVNVSSLPPRNLDPRRLGLLQSGVGPGCGQRF